MRSSASPVHASPPERSPASSRRASSARSSCSGTASWIASFTAASCAPRSRHCCASWNRSSSRRPVSRQRPCRLSDRFHSCRHWPTAAPDLSPDVWARLQLARNLKRPHTLELVAAMADEFIELHGDRLFGDDEALVAGLARIGGRRMVVIGQQKGAETDENIRRNFGMPHPEGYRKAIRLMELAERFRLPVVTFVDVPGANPGPASERTRIRLRQPAA